ncbi:DUF1194 domain-containing protein [Lacimonas salitolerans]|uniref:DUF1194 domain-containing protein n=1 Tax=Lacimonas salitolerans TaxID=1323750 RepID=A0ABW4EH59_9RHOB
MRATPAARVLATLALMALGQPAQAGCRLALLLGLDISSSVDAAEDRLQRQGLAAALAAPDVAEAILSVPGQGVVLSVFEWSGQVQQDSVMDWVILDSPQAIDRASAHIANSTRSYADFATAIGRALDFAEARFTRAPPCDRQILDLSGDGIHNDGPGPGNAYARGTLADVTVNGLAIVVDDPALDHADPGDLVAHYRDQVIRGPGAFVIRAAGFEDFQDAMRRKLLRELSVQIGQAATAPPHQ